MRSVHRENRTSSQYLSSDTASVPENSFRKRSAGTTVGGVSDTESRPGELPVRRVTLNQVCARNVTRFRKAAGMTQAELGERLGLSFRAVSAAERTWDRTDGKGRIFDAPLIASLARVLGVPVIAFLLPPQDDGTGARYVLESPGGEDLSMAALFALVMPESAGETPAMDAYRGGLADAAGRYMDPGEAGDLITYLRDMTNADHRMAVSRQRIEDLRAFEREYRSRLIAYLESQIKDLRGENGAG